MEMYEAFFRDLPQPAVIWRLRDGVLECVCGNRAAAWMFEMDFFEQGDPRALAATIFERIPYLGKDLRHCLAIQEPVFMYVSRRKGFRCSKESCLMRLNPGPDGLVFMHLLPCEEAESRRCYEKLQENRLFLQGFFDHAASGVAVWDLDYRYLFINTWECKRLGVARADVQGKRLCDIFPRERAALYCDHTVASLQQGVLFEESASIDGVSRYFQINTFYLFDADGEVYGIGCISRDVTDKKDLEEVSRANKHEFDVVLQHVPIMICYIDNTFHYRFVNKAYSVWYGREISEIEGKDIREFLGKKGFRRVEEPIMEAMRGQGRCFENSVMDADGVEHIFTAYYIPHFGPDKQLLGIVAMGLDITDRKRAEQDLLEQEKLLRDILDAIQDGVVVLDQELRIKLVNKFIEETYGRNRPLEKRHCYDVFFQNSTICEGCVGKKVLRTGKPHTMEREYITFEGKHGWMEMYAYPLRKDHGGVAGVVTYFRDITEKKRLMAEAVHAGQLACIGELAAGVAHEVNNPIMGVINYTQVLLDRKHLQGDGSEVLGKILAEGERIRQIVHNLLFFARDLKQKHGPIRIMDTLQGALDLIRLQLKRDNIALRCEIPETLPLVLGGDRELRQVFLNIISNARYALNRRARCRPYQKTLRISAESVRIQDKEHVRVFFRDNGTGISEHVQSKIFDPFFSTKPEGEGTGLGLSISCDIVREQGGTLSVESRENSHTTVIVQLPAVVST